MWTNQTSIFAVLLVAALISITFGWHVLVFIVAAFVILLLWSSLRHPNEWKGVGYSVRIRGGRDAWVEYEEQGRTLSLRAEMGTTKGEPELLILVEQNEYLSPDYANPLTEQRLSEIEARISEGLLHLHIRHQFTSLRTWLDNCPDR